MVTDITVITNRGAVHDMSIRPNAGLFADVLGVANRSWMNGHDWTCWCSNRTHHNFLYAVSNEALEPEIPDRLAFDALGGRTSSSRRDAVF